MWVMRDDDPPYRSNFDGEVHETTPLEAAAWRDAERARRDKAKGERYFDADLQRTMVKVAPEVAMRAGKPREETVSTMIDPLEVAKMVQQMAKGQAFVRTADVLDLLKRL